MSLSTRLAKVEQSRRAKKASQPVILIRAGACITPEQQAKIDAGSEVILITRMIVDGDSLK